MGEPDPVPEELEGEGPAVLPEREAMSILSQPAEPEDIEEDSEAGDT
jgi:hypothetical protein